MGNEMGNARTEGAFTHSAKKLNRVGDHLRRAAERGEPLNEDDLEILDEFRAWHRPTVVEVRERLTNVFYERFQLDPGVVAITGRPLKTHGAIVAKLIRERTRLSRMQDIAGARIVVPALALQEAIQGAVINVFRNDEIRLTKDSVEEANRWGYRAIHLVVRLSGRWAEIQLRTVAQDAWAQLVERVDQTFGHDLKHGRGPAEWLEWLQEVSDALRKADLGEPTEIPPMPIDQPQEQDDV